LSSSQIIHPILALFFPGAQPCLSSYFFPQQGEIAQFQICASKCFCAEQRQRTQFHIYVLWCICAWQGATAQFQIHVWSCRCASYGEHAAVQAGIRCAVRALIAFNKQTTSQTTGWFAWQLFDCGRRIGSSVADLFAFSRTRVRSSRSALPIVFARSSARERSSRVTLFDAFAISKARVRSSRFIVGAAVAHPIVHILLSKRVHFVRFVF
jgi:hypothetical protein